MHPAYVAAYMDGEGTYVLRRKKKTSGTMQVHVSCTSTYKPVLDKLQEKYGGSVRLRKASSTHIGKKPCYTWSLTGRQKLVRFLVDTVPYNIEKQNKALTMLVYLLKRDALPYNFDKRIDELNDSVLKLWLETK